jgi:hypothetical protein
MFLTGSPSDLAVLALVVGARFLVPLLIPWYPLPGVLAALLLDAVDQSLFQGLTHLPLEGYQAYDKALDVYYQSIAYLATLRNWENAFAFRLGRALFYLRLVGVGLFEWLDWRLILFLLPNTFEYYFIWYELLRLRRDPRRLTPTTVVSAAAAIWIVIKLPQEYWLHIARLDLTDVLKTALFGASPQTPWGHIFRAAPWLFVGVAALGVGVLVTLAWLAGRGHPADHPPPASDPSAPTIATDATRHSPPATRYPWQGPPPPPHAALRAARDAWAAHVLDRDLAEKLLLAGLLTAVFAQILPGTRPATPLVVLGAVVVVTLTTALTHALARRGVRWSNALGQFLVMLGANFTAVFLYRALPGTRDLDEAAVLFFVLLLSVIVTLFDRFQIIQQARRKEPPRTQTPGAEAY